MFYIYLNKHAFWNIKYGIKKYEIRLERGVFKAINKEDRVIFKIDKLCYEKVIIEIIRFNDLKSLLLTLGIQNCIPNVNNLEDAIIYMNRFYSQEKIKSSKFIALRVN